MLTLAPPDADAARSFLKHPSPQAWGTICRPPGRCMLQETLPYQLCVHDLPLQSVSIKDHLLNSSKKSPVDWFLVPETPLSPILLNLLFPPILTLPHHGHHTHDLLIADLPSFRNLSITAQHTTPLFNLPQQRAGPGST